MRIWLGGLLIVWAGIVFAEEGVITLRSTVKGNQEQPKVMYVLPWQSADPVQVEYQPDNRWLGEVFDPVDRDEFIRELHYREVIGEK